MLEALREHGLNSHCNVYLPSFIACCCLDDTTIGRLTFLCQRKEAILNPFWATFHSQISAEGNVYRQYPHGKNAAEIDVLSRNPLNRLTPQWSSLPFQV